MERQHKNILELLPYSKPFLFVDEILKLDENGCEGHYTFTEKEFFYKGHFIGNPVTPGVILTECMAQIGLVCLGLFLLVEEQPLRKVVALTATEIEYYKPVFPGEKVWVRSEKIYFRFQKLKCKVRMTNQKGELVALGTISGMLTTPS